MGRHQRDGARFLRGDVFGQFEMHRAGTFFGRDTKGVADQRRNARCAHDLLRLFRQRAHRGHDVDNLEMRLSALADRLLTGDQHHRHATEKTVSGACDEVERTGTKRAERDPRLSRKPPIGGCQESRRLLMTGYHQFDGGLPKAFDDIEVLLTGYPEDSIDALVLEGRNQKIRSLHFRSPLYIQRASSSSVRSRRIEVCESPIGSVWKT